MATWSDAFTSDPSSRWTAQFGSFATWVTSGQWDTNAGGCYAINNVAVGSRTQYVKVTLVNAAGGAVLRATGTASDGFYVVIAWSGAIYFQRGNNTGLLADMTNDTLATSANDVLGITIDDNTGVSATVRVWKNPTNNAPVDASNWDSASDPPDVTLNPSGGTYYDAGNYCGIGIDAEVTFGASWGGALGGEPPPSLSISVALEEPTAGGSPF